MSVRLVHEEHPAPADVQGIEDRIGDFNVATTGHNDYAPLAIFLRDADGRLRGGILGHVWGRWLHVRFLWVDGDLRRQGLATGLLAEAEAWAAARGAVGAFLDTFSFQAGPGFYERRGYAVFGTLDDHPQGHTGYYLKKALTPRR